VGRLTTALVAAIAFATAGLALTSCGSSDESAGTTTVVSEPTTTEATPESGATPPAGPTVVRVLVVEGSPRGGIVRRTVTQGDRVVLVVESDVADEVHLHGYDLMKNVSAGGTARLAFSATLPGRFEVELEDRGVQIAQLTVQP
jgi:hypothetical protein